MKFKELFEADTWAKELAKANREKAKRETELKKLNKKIAMKPALKTPKLSTEEIFKQVETSVGNSFPDGDPIDHLIPWMEKNSVTMDQIDAAVKKHAKPAKSMYGYLAIMWDDTSSDAMHDAQNGHIDSNSPFYRMENDKPVKNPNPWK
jgi:hypothetical protein